MKICLVSYEYAPFPGGGIATYHNAVAHRLAEAGHEVHVVTNSALHGRTGSEFTQRYWSSGNLHVHRLPHFDEQRNPPADAQFLDVTVANYGDRRRLWAAEASNLAAHKVAAHVENLHRSVGLDVVEAPEFFAEAFYILRRRHAGWRHCFPPVCIHGHISSRLAFGANRHVWELGLAHHRYLMWREEYCLTHADALVTPSRALMQRYEERFGDRLPELRATIPYVIDIPDEVGALPPALDGGVRYLVCVGRIEPRKGADVAMAAFARLADEDSELKLVFLGREMWQMGESVDDVVDAMVPPRHRHRVLRLGSVPRSEALSAVVHAVAFLHPVPWDNYPCAVLEAMSVGATCIVSDQGGQAEMVEDGVSGLVCPAGDAAAVADAVRRVLGDPDYGRCLGVAAAARVREITDPATVLAAKLELFDAMVAREAAVPAPVLGAFEVPAALRPGEDLPPLPGTGVVLLDGGGAEASWVTAAFANLAEQLRTSAGWTTSVLLDTRQEVEVPASWSRISTLDVTPWLTLAPDALVVYVRAGVRFDRGRLHHLVAQAVESPVPCGSFAWLRPATPRVFPYGADFSYRDLLQAGHSLPAAFVVAARYLSGCTALSGLLRPEHRACGLIAAAAAAGRDDVPAPGRAVRRLLRRPAAGQRGSAAACRRLSRLAWLAAGERPELWQGRQDARRGSRRRRGCTSLREWPRATRPRAFRGIGADLSRAHRAQAFAHGAVVAQAAGVRSGAQGAAEEQGAAG